MLRITRQPHQRLPVHELSVLIAEPSLGKNEIDRPCILHFIKYTGKCHRQFHIDGRMRAYEIFQHRRQAARHKILGNAKPQPPTQAAALEQRLHLPLDRQHRPRMCQQGFAIAGQHDLVRITLQQPAPE